MTENAEYLLLRCINDTHRPRFSTSAIIAPELLPVISSHLVQNPNPYPILHEIPPPFRLHRFDRRLPFTNHSPPPIPCQVLDEKTAFSPSRAGLRNGVSISQALQLAMSTGITGKGRYLPLRVPTPSGLRTTPVLNDRVITLETKQPVIGNMLLSSCPGKKGMLLKIDLLFHRLTSFPHLAVRLTGPVGGRVGVCRDLSRDLERMRTLGVGCIVWYFPFLSKRSSLAKARLSYSCLDDSELAYLGVSWSDYARIADEIGIDVLR